MTTVTETLDKVLHLATLVNADMERFHRETGLTAARTHLLWVLGLAGPSTQQSLAVALSVSPRNVTGLVDGLVASGHVTREAHPQDRRATLVTPTRAGARALQELQESHQQLAEQLFGDLPAEKLELFTGLVEDTLVRFARLMEEL